MGVKLLFPRGFCFGVTKAIELLEKTITQNLGKEIFVYNEIVHNKQIIDKFSKQGVKFINSLDLIHNQNSIIVFSAHGVNPNIKKDAIKRGLEIVDATCPIVQTNHRLANKYSNMGYTIIIIGDESHEEIKGLIGEINSEYFVVSNIEDIEKLELGQTEKITYITQTTLNIDDTIVLIDKLQEKYPLTKPINETQICFATKERQGAIKDVKTKVDLVLVCGSKNSSNSNKLVKVAQENLNPTMGSFLIQDLNDVDKIDISNCNEIIITSGASVPEDFTMKIYKLVLELKK